MNPARSFGPAVVARQFNRDHWIYWIAPICGGILSVVYFSFLKLLKYNSVVLDQDSDTEITGLKPIHVRLWNFVRHGQNPSALNPESSTHYDSKARAEFDQEQREVFEEREQIRAQMMDKPVFDGHDNNAAEGRISNNGHGSPVSTGSTLAHTTESARGPSCPSRDRGLELERHCYNASAIASSASMYDTEGTSHIYPSPT